MGIIGLGVLIVNIGVQAQPAPLVEASVSQMQSGTAGSPFYVSPRRNGAATVTVFGPTNLIWLTQPFYSVSTGTNFNDYVVTNFNNDMYLNGTYRTNNGASILTNSVGTAYLTNFNDPGNTAFWCFFTNTLKSDELNAIYFTSIGNLQNIAAQWQQNIGVGAIGSSFYLTFPITNSVDFMVYPASGFVKPVAFDSAFYASTNGSDLLGQQGIYPWKTLSHAVTNATTQTAINVGTGTYDGISQGTNQILTGSGIGKTIIANVGSSGGGNIYRDMSINGASWGFTGTNNIAYNLDVGGWSLIDGYYSSANGIGNRTEGSAYNCNFYSSWDAGYAFSVVGASNAFSFYSCNFISLWNTNALQGGGYTGNHGFIIGAEGNYNFYGGSIVSSNGTVPQGSSSNACLFLNNALSGRPITVNLYGTELRFGTTNVIAPTYGIAIQGGSNTVTVNGYWFENGALKVGQNNIFTGNGSGLTNIIANAPTIIKTNLSLATVGVNTWGRPIQICSFSVNLSEAGVVGVSGIQLEVPNQITNRVSSITSIAGTIVGSDTNALPGAFVPVGGTWNIRDISQGVGNSSSIGNGGQQIIVY